jgi:hypothetical protein
MTLRLATIRDLPNRSRRADRSPVGSLTPIAARPSLARASLLFRGSRVDAAAPVIAGAPSGARPLFIIAHVYPPPTCELYAGLVKAS